MARASSDDRQSILPSRNHGPDKFFDLGDFLLEDGGVIPNLKIAYTSFDHKAHAKLCDRSGKLAKDVMTDLHEIDVNQLLADAKNGDADAQFVLAE